MKKIGKVPIYTTSFTASVLKRKFWSIGLKNIEINLLKYNCSKTIGAFNIEILALTHSIPEPNAIILRAKKLNVFHTGDWKIDPEPLVGKPIDENKLKSLKDEGIDVMICDSTNVFDETHLGVRVKLENPLEIFFQIKKLEK